MREMQSRGWAGGQQMTASLFGEQLEEAFGHTADIQNSEPTTAASSRPDSAP
jgi:hypothetical protein